MPSRNPSTPPRPARAIDLLSGAFLFLATAAFVLWQNAHLTVLWDLSYILENATRISLGQLPYRDFPFPYAPGTFLVQAAIIKLFGPVIFHHYVYAAVAGGLATLLTWRILIRLLSASQMPERVIAFLLAAPLVFLGTNSIFPHPFYDSDCTLFILFCIWMLLHLEARGFPAMPTFICGVLLAVPAFIKQNTGLAFLLSVSVCIAWMSIRQVRAPALLLAGTVAGFALALAGIQATVGLGNYYHWTIQFAASRRLPGLATMVGVYKDPALIWSFLVFSGGIALFVVRPALLRARQNTLRWVGAALLAFPFLWTFIALFVEEDASDRVEALLHLWPVLLVVSLVFALRQLPRASTFAQLVPLALLGAIHGAFFSQQLWGSTYALWPLLMILIATIVIALAPCASQADATLGRTTLPLTVFSAVVSVMLLICGGYYALSHERLQYVDLSGDTLAHSSLPSLRGLGMRGDWLPDFEELVAYSDREIPRADAMLMVPGEDLFYFTTGRRPQFPVLMMDNTVNPYSAAQIVDFARQRSVRWLIVKRNLQLQEEPLVFRTQLLELLSHDYSLVESLNNYDVYKRN